MFSNVNLYVNLRRLASYLFTAGVRSTEIQKSRNPEIQKSRNPEIQKSEFLNFWISGFLDSWISGFLDFWISGFLDFWISGFLDSWIPGFLDFWISVRLQAQAHWIPVCLCFRSLPVCQQHSFSPLRSTLTRKKPPFVSYCVFILLGDILCCRGGFFFTNRGRGVQKMGPPCLDMKSVCVAQGTVCTTSSESDCLTYTGLCSVEMYRLARYLLRLRPAFH